MHSDWGESNLHAGMADLHCGGRATMLSDTIRKRRRARSAVQDRACLSLMAAPFCKFAARYVNMAARFDNRAL